jgi:hypothetical protein
LSRAFAKASSEALHLEACQKMRACVYPRPFCADARHLRRKVAGRRIPCCRRHASGGAPAARSAKAQPDFFLGAACLGVPEGHQGACWASNYPLFF